MSSIKKYNESDFIKLRKAGKLAAIALDNIKDKILPGISTQTIDEIIKKFLRDHNAYPAPLFYRGYPKSICTSINHVVCHGIPSDKELKNGDILNIDVTAYLDGFHGDCSKMFHVGDISVKAKNLINVTKECLNRSIKILKPGIHFGNIGHVIQSFAEEKGFSVVREFCGHGVGKNFHEEPNVLHYGNKNEGPILEEGMVFTIEPMINEGKFETKVLKDGWTAVTKDKSLSAQFEHTVGITNNGYEIFTLNKN